MNRLLFVHIDEIRLRLSDIAEDKRVQLLAITDGPSRLDRLLKDIEDTQRAVVAALRRRISQRSPRTWLQELVA